jgi:YVTN family beta-propeller protein
VHAVWLDAERIAAAALWDPHLLILDAASLQPRHSHRIDVEPGEILAPPGGMLAVADAFRGRIVLLQPEVDGSAPAWPVEGVSIRGLATSPDGVELLFVSMVSAGPTQLTRTSIDWGQVLSSKLAGMRLEALEEGLEDGSPSRASPRPRMLTLDGSKHGAADPSALAVSADGRHLYIAASGAHQVLHVDRALGGPSGPGHLPLGDTLKIRSVEAGRTPVALALDPSGRWLVTADSMSDTLSVIDTRSLVVERTIALTDGPAERTPAQRGEALFQDGRLALDRWIT